MGAAPRSKIIAGGPISRLPADAMQVLKREREREREIVGEQSVLLM